MSVTRTADTTVNTNILRDLSRTSLNIEQSNREITTGTRVHTYKDAGDDTARIMNLEDILTGLTSYKQSGTTVTERLRKMEISVRQINDIAVEYRARLNKATSFGVTDTTFQSFCQSKLEEVQRLLNTQDSDRRYLFGGYETTSPPVDISLLAAPAPGALVSYDYYLGTTDSVSAKISDLQELHYGITAGNDGFAKLIHALKIGATSAPSSDTNTIDYQKLKNSATPLMEEVSSAIPDILQEIGISMRVVEQTNERNQSTHEMISNMLADLKDADPVKSMFELGKEQVKLQFSMIAHQHLSQNLDSLLSLLRNG